MADQPECNEENRDIFQAFLTLSASRHEGAPIAISEMKAYMDIFRVTDSELFVRRIQIMDNALLKFQNKKMSKNKI